MFKPLPQWPTPAGWEQWDVPWLHSDTFIITKNNSSSEQKTKKGPQRQTEGVEGTRPGQPRHANVPDDFALGGIWQAQCG